MPSSSRHFEDHVRGIEAVAVGIEIMVVGRQRGAGQHQFDEADTRRRTQRLLVDLVPVGIRHGAQPGEQRSVDAGPHALEHALEEVVVGGDEARIDHAAGRVDHPLAGLAFERADR